MRQSLFSGILTNEVLYCNLLSNGSSVSQLINKEQDKANMKNGNNSCMDKKSIMSVLIESYSVNFSVGLKFFLINTCGK